MGPKFPLRVTGHKIQDAVVGFPSDCYELAGAHMFQGNKNQKGQEFLFSFRQWSPGHFTECPLWERQFEIQPSMDKDSVKFHSI